MQPAFVPPVHLPGAVCPRHSDHSAVGTCGRCGSFICTECLRFSPDGLTSFCPDCAPAQLDLADRGRRFFAHLIDVLASVVPMLVIALADPQFLGEELGTPLALGGLGLLVLWAGTQLSLAASGQSIGKRLLGIRVVRTSGERASWARIIFLRNGVVAGLGAFCGLVNLVDALMIFGQQQRCLHDLIADTIVVNVPAGRSLHDGVIG